MRSLATVLPLVPCVLLTAVSAPPGDGERPAFLPEEGRELQKFFDLVLELEVQDARVTFDGRDISPSDLQGGYRVLRRAVVTDRQVAVDDGRVTELERHFDALSGGARYSSEGPPDEDPEEESELEDLAVTFFWDEDYEEYYAEFAEEDEGEDEELLEGLLEDMTLRALLPPPVQEDVEVGDTWEIDPAALVHVLVPGGDLKVGDEEDTGVEEAGFFFFTTPELPLELPLWFAALEGEATAELVQQWDEDGTEVAVIAVEFELEAELDADDVLFGQVTANPEVGEALLKLTLTGEGELLWDVEAGHLRAFELEAEVEASFSASWTSRSGVNDYELTLQQELEGELLVRAGLGEGDEE